MGHSGAVRTLELPGLYGVLALCQVLEHGLRPGASSLGGGDSKNCLMRIGAGAMPGACTDLPEHTTPRAGRA